MYVGRVAANIGTIYFAIFANVMSCDFFNVITFFGRKLHKIVHIEPT